MKTFKQQLLSGVAYTASAKYIGLLISLLVTAVLSRMLPPEDFGIVAIAVTFINFFSLISTMGFAPAIVQNKELNDEDIKSIFSFTLYLSLGCALLFIALIPLLVWVYEKEILSNILLILSLNIVFSILSIVPNALLFKNKEFKYIAIRTLWVQSIIGIFAISGAYMGLGIYALLVNPVLGSLVILIISYRKYPVQFRFIFKKSSIKKIFSFSAYQVLFNIAVLVYKSLDKLLTGKVLGMTHLGYYEKSYRLMTLPLDNIGSVISPVLHPLLSEHQNDKAFVKDKYERLVTILAYIGLFMSVFFYFTARESILIVFGDQWMPSVASFQILALSIWTLVVQSAVGPIFQSINNTKGLFFASLWATGITLIGVVTGLILGSIEWVAGALVVANLFVLIAYNRYLYLQSLETPLIDFFKLLIKPLCISLIYAAIMLGLTLLYEHENKFVSMAIKCAESVVIMLIFYKFKLLKDLPLNRLKK